MKGHMQDGKFHPHTDYKKGIRKSRDQRTKHQGLKIRRDRAFDNSGKIVGQATWTGHGRGFGHSYGWQVPDGAFHVINKRNIPESLRPNGGVEISSGKFKGKILDLKDGKIHFEHLKGVCNFCGQRGFDVRKGCPNNCGKILRDAEGNVTAIVGTNFVRKARGGFGTDNLVTTELKKLNKNPDFKFNDNGVWGYSKNRIILPTYGAGAKFGQSLKDLENKVYHFGSGGGFTLSNFGTDIDAQSLSEIEEDALKNKLISRPSSIRTMIDNAEVFTSQEINDQPVIFRIEGNGKVRYYMIAPTVLDER